jgi:photosystem II stability/assembly factor-like uncharacterized protein
VYAGNGGSVYRSNDDGDHWTPANTGLAGQEVLALAVRGTTLFAAIYGGGVFRSDNHGDSWTNVTGDITIFVEALGVMSDNSVFVGTHAAGGSTGVFRSTNNGNTWTSLGGLPNTPIAALAGQRDEPVRRHSGQQRLAVSAALRAAQGPAATPGPMTASLGR